MPYYIYIIYSPNKDKYYIGQTEDVEKRLAEHRIRKNLGASDWELRYTESYETRSEAVKREIAIKAKKSRAYLVFLIAQNKI